MFSPNITSFTTSGFFREAGYVEPRISASDKNLVPALITTGVILLVIVLITIWAVIKCKKMKK